MSGSAGSVIWRWPRVVAAQVVSLFVADWVQTAGILGILGAGWVGVRWGLPAAGFLVALALAGHLVWSSAAEARRRRR